MLRTLLCASFLLWAFDVSAAKVRMEILAPTEGLPKIESVEAVTHGPKHHFFGYYGICPWDASGRYLLCLETDFADRKVEEGDTAAVCRIDLTSGLLSKVGTSNAFNFQQGAMLHWAGPTFDRHIVFNDRVEGVFRGVKLDTVSGERSLLAGAVAGMAPDGLHAASLNYARLRLLRPVVGYAGGGEAYADDPHPKEDGVFLMDLDGGAKRLVVSIDDVYHAQPVVDFGDSRMWLNHVIFSRDGKRLFFLGRYGAKGRRYTAAFSVGVDGSGLRCVIPYEWGASHFDWVDGSRLMVTTRYEGGTIMRHLLFTDGKKDYRVVAPKALEHDGHCAISPDGKWMVTDSYARGRKRMQSLYLVSMETDTAAEAARFHTPREYRGVTRCDLHPRWNREGTQLCIDSSHDGTRQVYLVKLGPVKDD